MTPPKIIETTTRPKNYFSIKKKSKNFDFVKNLIKFVKRTVAKGKLKNASFSESPKILSDNV